MTVRLTTNPWLLLIFFGLLVVATRLPLSPGQLFSFDDVNLAYSIGNYDVRISQPHPPGYPLFVLEMRALSWLRFKRAESILLILSLGGSILALLLAVWCGNRIFGGDSGFWAAVVLLPAPAFWYAGLTSALRVQLAVVSLAVAMSCWRAWTGEAAWVRRSAIALAIGAGIRPEIGAVLFPLWAASALRAPVDWAERRRALLWMAGTVSLWLLPAMFASGGPVNFIRANLDYLADQASLSSGLFGASDNAWLRTFYQTLVWVFCGVVGLALPMVLAWRWRDGWGIGWSRLAFLALWIGPPFAFALSVHVADPGQTLMMGVVVALVGGYWIDRAFLLSSQQVTRLLIPASMAVACAMIQVWSYPNDIWRIQWMAVVAIGFGLVMKLAPVGNEGHVPRWQVAILILTPLLYTNYTYFYHRGWYYKGTATTGIAAVAERAWSDINSGFAMTSLEQIHNTLAIDDYTLRETRRLIAERPGKTVVVWERGLTAWRKVGYYAAGASIYVLEHKEIRGGSPVIAVWQGDRITGRQQGPAPQRVKVPAGSRVIWLLDPRAGFTDLVKSKFPLVAAGPAYYTELPEESGSRTLGEYEIAW